MTIQIQQSGKIGRTIFETDCRLFSELFECDFDIQKVDRRLIIMITTGLLNRSLNLEQYLVAVLGQNWTFLQSMQVGQTLHCNYEINLLKEEKKVYQINIDLIADQKLVAKGIWTLMFNQLLI